MYVTNALDKIISPKIEKLKEDLSLTLASLKITSSFLFLNAQDLLDLTELNFEKIELKFVSQPLEVKDRHIDVNGYAGFITGQELITSLLDDSGVLKSHLTEGNVRFFLGENTSINSSIIETAKDNKLSEIFWAMNNGLTIIGDSITPLSSNEYSIDNPQIVNGCQTVHCLNEAYKLNNNKLPDNLKIFVKIVNTDNLEIQTSIISATNSQNPVKASSLKANDDIQRNIEKHLLKSGIYYERRENYYKRQNITGNKVISLLKLSQILISTIIKESISAINDPSKFFDSDEKYKTIFDANADYDIYSFSCLLYQKTWNLKNSDQRINSYTQEQKNIVSKSGFLLTHCISSIILSKVKFKNNAGIYTTEPYVETISLDSSNKKSKFILRKEKAFDVLENEILMKKYYDDAIQIIFSALNNYALNTQKDILSAFKNRSFDKDYLIPEIEKYLTN